MNMEFFFIKGKVDLPTWMKIFKLVEWHSDHQLKIVLVNILSFKQIWYEKSKQESSQILKAALDKQEETLSWPI